MAAASPAGPNSRSSSKRRMPRRAVTAAWAAKPRRRSARWLSFGACWSALRGGLSCQGAPLKGMFDPFQSAGPDRDHIEAHGH